MQFGGRTGSDGETETEKKRVGGRLNVETEDAFINRLMNNE